MIDLLVIGAGLSGLLAAYTASSAGLRVRVVSKGLSSLHWSAGTIDVLGYLPGVSEAVAQPLSLLDSLPPGHPYRVLGREPVAGALAAFQSLTAALGLAYVGAPKAGDNLLLPSPAGAARPTFLAPQSQAAGSLVVNTPLLIVGFHGLHDFFPHLIAENLRRQGHACRAAMLPLSLLTSRRNANTVQLARDLERGERRQALAAALAKLARPDERIGLPAVLGLDDHQGVLASLQQSIGNELFEIPTLPPSVPGIRLFRKLRGHLLSRNVQVEAGMEAVDVKQDGKRILAVATASSARPLWHHASQFVLATGGILGGGASGEPSGRVRETLFDLPLSGPQQRRDWFRSAFLAERGHPVFAAGARIKQHLRPVDDMGNSLYENLRVVGGAIGRFDGILERSREGVAVATGMNVLNDPAEIR